jgi:hypothetical protein
MADRLAQEPAVERVSVLGTDRWDLQRFMLMHSLDRLVVGGCYGRISAGGIVADMPELAGLEVTAVRAVDLTFLCHGLFAREQATSNAVTVLLAAVARVRSQDVLTAGFRDELQVLIGRGEAGSSSCVPVLACPAGLDSLRVVGQSGIQHYPFPVGLEVPCDLNGSPLATAEAINLGAEKFLTLGCVPGCVRGGQAERHEIEDLRRRVPQRSTWEDRRRATVTVYSLRGLVETLDDWLRRV